jgi:glycerol-3-phosphate dehydrogenase
VALEASTRGLSCGLIELGDFASQTSSKSTKLIHGGIRYLENAFMHPSTFWDNMELVAEGLRERTIMIESANYMNEPIQMFIPNTSYFKQVYAYAGTLVYYLISKL